MQTPTLSDPSQLAQAVRSLAHDAHHTLNESPSPTDLRRLSRRIERLASALDDRRGNPLSTWLDNLGRDVRSAAVRQAETSRRLCLCA